MKIADKLKEWSLDAIVVSDPYNMRYLSGFSGGEGFVYISDNNCAIITDSRYTTSAGQEKNDGFEVITTSIGHSGYDVIKELSISDRVKSVGYEDLFLTCNSFEKLKKCFDNNIELKPLFSKLDSLRIIKTPKEIEKMRTAEAIGDMAFTHILNCLKAGMTELEVAAEIEYSMKRNGACGLSFSTIAATGPNSACPHAVPGKRTLAEGDFLVMDFGCIYEGYCSDMTRTVVIGKASEKQKEIYNTVLLAQTEALKNIKSGVIGADIHKIAADVISNAGYGDYFGHGLGHSVGLYIHENPRFSPSEKNPILAGTIETVEPGIYIPEFGGVRIEDMIVITENGYENLTNSPKKLIEI